MNLSQAQKKFYRTIGHELNPIVTVAGKGLTDNLSAELERALEQHELIKIKVIVGDRSERDQLLETICANTTSVLIQRIGNVALLLRRAKKPDPKLSNLKKYQNL